MDLVNKFLEDFKEFYVFDDPAMPPMLEIRPRIVCKDGFHVSIQASHTHYCTPREDEGPYRNVELGYPSDTPGDSILEYAETPDDPTNTVYGYVPVILVLEMIEEHGGIVGTKKAGSEITPYGG